MKNGTYTIGKRRIVINDHSTQEQKDELASLLNDNDKKKSVSNGKGKSKSE